MVELSCELFLHAILKEKVASSLLMKLSFYVLCAAVKNTMVRKVSTQSVVAVRRRQEVRCTFTYYKEN